MLDNLKSATLILMMATISSKIEIKKITVPKLKNSSVYQIFCEEEGIDFTLNLSEKQDNVDNLRRVVGSLWKEYTGEYLIDESVLQKEDKLLNIASKLFIKYAQKHDVSDYLDKIQVYSNDFNALNNEFLVVCGAEHTGVAIFNDVDYLKMDGYLDKLLQNMYRVINEEKQEVLRNCDWYTREEDSTIGEATKEKAKLITYAVINNQVAYVFGTNKALGNTLVLFEAEDDSSEPYAFHTKKGKEEVNAAFAEDFYNKYLREIHIGISEETDVKVKEKVVRKHMLQNVNLENALQYVIAFVESIYGTSNLGEDDIVTKAVALNAISLLEHEGRHIRVDGVASYNISEDELGEIFEENYKRAASKDNKVLGKVFGVYKRIADTNAQFEDIIKSIRNIEQMLEYYDEDSEDEDENYDYE